MPNRLLTIGAAAALAVVSIGAATPAFASDRGCSDVTVTITADHHLHMPTHLTAGALRFRVHGPAEEDLQLVRPKHGATPQQLVDDGNLLNTTENPVPLEHDFSALGGAASGDDLWVRLSPGTYYAIDTGSDDPATVDQVLVLHVRGDVHRGHLPATHTTIAAIHDMDWAAKPTRIPASGILRFVNASTDYHFIALQEVKPGTTQAQLDAALKNNDQSIFVGFADGGDGVGDYTGVLSPWKVQESSYDLPRGEYALVCFWPDENGVPHALMGMDRLIHLG